MKVVADEFDYAYAPFLKCEYYVTETLRYNTAESNNFRNFLKQKWIELQYVGLDNKQKDNFTNFWLLFHWHGQQTANADAVQKGL